MRIRPVNRLTHGPAKIRRRFRIPRSVMTIRRAIAAAFLALVWAFDLAAQTAQAPAREPLNVMSFNIRYGTANDGENQLDPPPRVPDRRDARGGRRPRRSPGGARRADCGTRSRRCRSMASSVSGATMGGRGESMRRFCTGAIGSGSRTRARSGFRIRRRSWRRDRGGTGSRASARGRGSSIATGSAFWHYNVHLDHHRSRRASAARRCWRADRGPARAARAGDRHWRFQRR